MLHCTCLLKQKDLARNHPHLTSTCVQRRDREIGPKGFSNASVAPRKIVCAHAQFVELHNIDNHLRVPGSLLSMRHLRRDQVSRALPRGQRSGQHTSLVQYHLLGLFRSGMHQWCWSDGLGNSRTPPTSTATGHLGQRGQGLPGDVVLSLLRLDAGNRPSQARQDPHIGKESAGAATNHLRNTTTHGIFAITCPCFPTGNEGRRRPSADDRRGRSTGLRGGTD